MCYGELASEFAEMAAVVAGVPVGKVFQDDVLIERDRFHASRVWREWMAPQDMYGGMACRTLRAMAPSGSSMFNAAAIRRGSTARISRCSGISRQRRAASPKCSGIWGASGSSATWRGTPWTRSVAVLIVDQSLQLVYANAMADDILANPKGALNLRSGACRRATAPTRQR